MLHLVWRKAVVVYQRWRGPRRRGVRLRQREVAVDEVLRGLVDAAGGDDVGDAAGGVAEGVAGKGIEDDGWLADRDAARIERRRQQGRKVAGAERRREPECLLHHFAGLAADFVVKAPETAILPVIDLREKDRTADKDAELVAAQDGLARFAAAGGLLKIQEVVFGGELVIPKEFVECAVELIGA